MEIENPSFKLLKHYLFSPSFIRIREEGVGPSPIHYLVATDADQNENARISYAVLEPASRFAVDAQTGSGVVDFCEPEKWEVERPFIQNFKDINVVFQNNTVYVSYEFEVQVID